MKSNNTKNSYVKAVKSTRDENRKKQSKSTVFASNSKGRFLCGFKKFLGVFLMAVGILTLAALSIRSHHYGTEWSFTHYFYVFVLGTGIFFWFSAIRSERQMARFRYYRSFMDGKEYILLSEIESITGRKASFLRKDLCKMSQKKLFLQACMDEEGTCLFLTREAYQSYCNGHLILMTEREKAAKEEKTTEKEKAAEKAAQEEKETDTESVNTRADFIKSDVEETATKKRKSKQPEYKKEETKEQEIFEIENEKIGEPQIDWEAQLYRINETLGQIRNPDIMKPVADICIRGQQMIYFKDTAMKNVVKRFLDYYLPVTNQILTTYKELEKEELEEQAADLVVILNTIQNSFVSCVEKLIEGKRVDVEEDIAAMEMMLSGRNC